MSTTSSALLRVLSVAVFALSACRSAREDTRNETKESAPPTAPAAPARPAPVDAVPVDAAPVAVASAQAVDDEFRKLLSGLGVNYSPADRTLEISGWVNMRTGLVEVFACAPQGKTHEAVVVLDCVPSGLHAGLLALGLEPGTPVEFGTGDEYRPPKGDLVEIEVRWRDESGVERIARAEDWIWDQKQSSAMPRAPWIFAGSFLQPVSGGDDTVTYAADYIKSLATTYHDASSILENPHSGGVDDTMYFAHEAAVPPVGTPLRAVFRRAR